MTPAAVSIAERIWPAWRARAEEYHEWQLQLLFSPTADGGHTEDALLESLREVAESLEAEAERSGDPDPPLLGEWSTARVPGGVVVHVTESEVFDTALAAVARGLELRGVAGTIDLWEKSPGVRPPTRAAMLACRIRIRGERVRRGERWYEWAADRGARAALLAGADAWCRTGSDSTAHSLTLGTAGTLAVARDEDVLARMHDAVERGDRATLTTVEGDSFRGVNADVTGALTLVTGGDVVERGGWREPLAELTRFLHDRSEHVAYAYVMRGWAVETAVGGEPLLEDWPQRADQHPLGAGWTRAAFEDLYAPDAFGVQLLGPGYAGRGPSDRNAWRTESIDGGSILVQHTDVDAWFTRPFIPLGPPTRAQRPSEPEVLRTARAELAGVLYARGVLVEHGFADMDDR